MPRLTEDLALLPRPVLSRLLAAQAAQPPDCPASLRRSRALRAAGIAEVVGEAEDGRTIRHLHVPGHGLIRTARTDVP